MSGRIVFDGGVKSQPIDAVKSMIEFFDGEPCQKLPAKVQLANGWQLTKSSKGDCYYVTSAKECSCPGFFYRQSCTHVKALLKESEDVGCQQLPRGTPEDVAEHTEKAPKPWAPSHQKSEKILPVLLVDAYAFDVKPGEVEYWQKKEQKPLAVKTEQELSPTQVFARDIVVAM
jgi:hypothetical protein